jgi:hypothetical protein
VVTGRHAGRPLGASPDYAYTGQHEAQARPGCRAAAHVADTNGEAGGMLVCNRDEHPDPDHYDETDGIVWRIEPAYTPAVAEPAGAVA